MVLELEEDVTNNETSLAKTGVLLINLGTPSSYSKKDIACFLNEFLSDPRVVELPAIFWRPILRCLIIPLRSGRLSKKYQAIWHEEGPPLEVYTKSQATKLLTLFKNKSYHVDVDYGMRYGKHSIAETIKRMKKRGVEKILLLPLYPQYASSTTGSSLDAVYNCLAKMRNQLAVRSIKSFADHYLYIQALVSHIKDYWSKIGYPNFGQGDKLLLSFHGLPKNTVDLGDPYYEDCKATAFLLRRALDLTEKECILCFQSRFGYQEWLQPYTSETVLGLAQLDCRRLDIFCPGFAADCLETLEEINFEVRALFESDNREFNVIPCVNDGPHWISFLGELALEHLQGWECFAS